MIKTDKSEFFNERIAENKNNPRKLWKSLKLLGYSNRLKTKTHNLNLDFGGTIISDKLKVANS